MSTGAPMLSVFVNGKPVSVNSMYGLRGPKRPAMLARPKGSRKRPKAKYLTTEALAWRDSVSYDTMVKLGTLGRPQGEIEVHCTLYGVRGDADNYAKLTLDGLKYALQLDDRFFNPVVLAKEKLNGRERGCLIEIWQCHATEHGTEAVHDAERGRDSGAARVGGDADRAPAAHATRAGRAEREAGAAGVQRAARIRGGTRGPAVGPRTAKRAS